MIAFVDRNYKLLVYHPPEGKVIMLSGWEDTYIHSLSFRGLSSLKRQRIWLEPPSSCGADRSSHTGCSAGADSTTGKIRTYIVLTHKHNKKLKFLFLLN